MYSSTLKLSQLAPLLFLLRCLEADLRCHLSRCQHFSLQIEIISCAKELNPTAAFTCDILFAENVVWAGSTHPSSIYGLWIRRLVVSCICNSHLGTRKCLMLCSSELCEHTFESLYANVVFGSPFHEPRLNSTYIMVRRTGREKLPYIAGQTVNDCLIFLLWKGLHGNYYTVVLLGMLELLNQCKHTK